MASNNAKNIVNKGNAGNTGNTGNTGNAGNAGKIKKGVTNKWEEGKKLMKTSMQQTKESYGEMSNFMKLWILMIIILIIIILVYWAKSVRISSKNRSVYEPVLIDKPINAYDPSLSSQKINIPNSTEGLAFTYSFWIYIEDWNYNFGKFKNIISKGADNVGYSPGIWLYPNTNALHARISTYADPNEGCDVQNIPLQSWVNIVYILNTRTVDIYINGKLERSCVLKGVPQINNSPLKICQNRGFYGQISRLQYFAKAINPNKVAQLYRAGPFSKGGKEKRNPNCS